MKLSNEIYNELIELIKIYQNKIQIDSHKSNDKIADIATNKIFGWGRFVHQKYREDLYNDQEKFDLCNKLKNDLKNFTETEENDWLLIITDFGKTAIGSDGQKHYYGEFATLFDVVRLTLLWKLIKEDPNESNKLNQKIDEFKEQLENLKKLEKDPLTIITGNQLNVQNTKNGVIKVLAWLGEFGEQDKELAKEIRSLYPSSHYPYFTSEEETILENTENLPSFLQKKFLTVNTINSLYTSNNSKKNNDNNFTHYLKKFGFNLTKIELPLAEEKQEFCINASPSPK